MDFQNLSFSRIKAWALKKLFFIVLALIVVAFSSFETVCEGVHRLHNLISTTLDRKSPLYRKLGSLSTDMHIGHFIDVLGKPVFRNAAPYHFEEVFVNDLFYVQALVDPNGNVMVYSVTTRDKRFNPEFDIGLTAAKGKKFPLRLGRTKFGDLPAQPYHVLMNGEAGRFFFGEYYSMANLGDYQTFVFSVNDAGLIKVGNSSNLLANFYGHFDPYSLTMSEELKKFRNDTVINTYSVISANVDLRGIWIPFGPDFEQVKVISKK